MTSGMLAVKSENYICRQFMSSVSALAVTELLQTASASTMVLGVFMFLQLPWSEMGVGTGVMIN